MSKTEYFVDGLSELEKKMAKMTEQKFPQEFKRLVTDIAADLVGKVIENTPYITGDLRSGWEIGKIIKKGNEYIIEVYNNLEYVEPVEYGHRTHGGKGFVKGSHMMEISLAEVQAILPQYLQSWLNDFIEQNNL